MFSSLQRFCFFNTVKSVSAGAVCAACWLGPVQAQDSPVLKINAEAAKAEIEVTPLRDNLSMLAGSGGNILVLNSAQGMFLVDSGIGVSKPRLSKALADLGKGPVKYVVNTHWHWDHTDGNGWMKDQGATIVAHPSTLKHMSKSTRVEYWNYTFEPFPAKSLPTMLVAKDKTMTFDGKKIKLLNFADGHTDGDLAVYFEKADVLALGDTFWNGHYPFIDNGVGGSIDHMINWANKALKVCTPKTLVVPGHGPVGNRAQLSEFKDMLVTIRGNVATLKKQGKTLDETIAAKPTAAFDQKYGNFVINGDLFTRIVYDGLK